MNINLTLLPNQPVITVDQLLEKQWLVPRKVRHFLRMRKAVRQNGLPVTFQKSVYPGDIISITIEETDYDFQPVALGNGTFVDVLYEDAHLIIVNKPIHIKTHPNSSDEISTMQNHVEAYLAATRTHAYVVHRLDAETSGALLFAKNPFILPILGRMLEQKQITRTYQAIVSGSLTDNLCINKKIGRDRHNRKKRRVDDKNGQIAQTYVKIIQKGTNQTKIECQLATGRTHQIRVHLASIGHPIIGDPLYGTMCDTRMQLHAIHLQLQHPFTEKNIIVTAKPGLW